jgi:hypothetical protein
MLDLLFRFPPMSIHDAQRGVQWRLLAAVGCNTGFGGIVAISGSVRTVSRIGNDLVRGIIDNNRTLEICH